MLNYTLVAYKENSDDYCRGCVMARYDSDFEYLTTQSEEELISWWASYKTMNAFMEYNESGYGFFFFINGIHSDDYSGEGDDWEEKYNHIKSIKKRVDALADEKIKTKKAEEAEKERQKEVAQQQYCDQQERQQYEKLKKKFGDKS